MPPSTAAATVPANTPPSPPAASPPPMRPRTSWWLLLGFVLSAGLVGAVISYGFLGESLAALGISDPGILTTAGLPFVRSAALMLAALAGGSFLFSSFFTPPKDADKVDLLKAQLGVDGVLAARTGAYASLGLSACALLLVPMYLSDVSGETLKFAIQLKNWPIALQQVSTSVAFFAVAIIAFLTGVGARLSHRWCFQPLAFFGALAAIVPLGLEGHSATGGDHDYGTNSYLWHLLFFVLWVGGLMALIQHGRRRGTHMDVAVHRYSMVALWSVIGMALSGLINAAIRIPFTDWFSSGYGLLIFAKFAAVVILGLFGFWHRQKTLPLIAANPKNDHYFRRVAVVEVLVMAATVGVAIALSRTPPPPPITADINTMDIQLGYKLWKEPTFFNVWTMWRFDIAFGTLALLLAAAYLWGIMRLKSRGETWSKMYSFWFFSGCALLLLTMCSGIGMNIPATFSMHMVGHMILTMGVPPLLVLGAPLTLWDRAINPGPPGIPGPKEWLHVFIYNPISHFFMLPWVNTVQFVVLFYILYLTPLYDYAVWEHAGHLGMNTVFLWSGYIYYWELIGQDPKPVERSAMSRGAWLIFSMPFHLFFGIVLIHIPTVLAENFYTHLGLPWEMDLLWDQKVGGGIAWASGQFPLIIVFGVVFWEWYKEDKKEQVAYDEYADASGDHHMAEYNAMLQSLQQHDADTATQQAQGGSAVAVDDDENLPLTLTDTGGDYAAASAEPKKTKRRTLFNKGSAKRTFMELTDEEFAEWEKNQGTNPDQKNK